MISTQYIKLNMTPSGVLPVLYCSQYDIGRPLGLVVHNGSEPVDLDTYTATIEATRTDGTPITAAVTTDDNIGVFVTTAEMTNKEGKYFAKLALFDTNSRRVASLAFVMVITPATMDENAEPIQEDRSLYQQYTAAVQVLIAEIREDIADLQSQTHDTVASMKADTNLKPGMYARTGGYYAVNDGGGALYRIYSTAPATYYETLSNDLYAMLIIGDSVAPEQFGAYGDGTHDDSIAITRAVSASNTIVFSKSYKVTSSININGNCIKGCGHIYPTGDIYAFAVTDISKQTQIEEVTFHCDNGGGVSFNCLTTDGGGNPKPYTDYTPRQSTFIGAKFVCATQRAADKYGVKLVGAVDTIIDSCGFYGCGVYVDSSINVGIINSNFIDSGCGVYYATISTSNPAYTCGLRLVSCNIVGCTTGVYSNNTDVIIIDSCMIDYAWTALNLLSTVGAMIINTYITAYDYCLICNNTPRIQMLNCNISDHTNQDTGVPTVIFDLVQVGKGIFSNLHFITSALNLIKVGNVAETLFDSITAKAVSGTITLFYGNNLAASNSVANISLQNSDVSIGTGKTARTQNVLLTDYIDSFKGTFILQTDGTESTYITTIDTKSKLVNSGAIVGTVAGWRGDYSIAFSQTNGTITVVFDPANLPSGNFRVSYLVF